MHLAAADHGQRARRDRHRGAVEPVRALALADPDELVVVVPVRLAHARAADLDPVERDHLDRARHPVEAQAGRARSHAAAARIAAANASTSSARVSCEHIQRTSPVCSFHV